MPTSGNDSDRLGGRLRLLTPDELDLDQRQLYDGLVRTVVPESEQDGFTARLADGRLVGPFNALLRVPAIAGGMGAWTGRIATAGLAEDVRQVVILTVGAAWGAAYEIDAHMAGARAAGVPDAAIVAIAGGKAPSGLGEDAEVARRLTAALVVDHHVPDDLYVRAVARFHETGLVALLSLIGQYQTISGILTCFEVPVPPRPTG